MIDLVIVVFILISLLFLVTLDVGLMLYLVTIGFVTTIMILRFPEEGKFALKFRFVRGIICGMEAAILAYVFWIKLPMLGWDSVTVLLCIIMVAVSLVMMFKDLIQATLDFKCYPKGLWISKVKLVQSTWLHEYRTQYFIHGLRENGRRVWIRISRETLEDLCEYEEGSMSGFPRRISISWVDCKDILAYGDERSDKFLFVKIYPRTKIFAGVVGVL